LFRSEAQSSFQQTVNPEVHSLTTVPRPSAEAIRNKIDDIFARPEFSQDRGTSWLDELFKLLASAFDWLGGLHEAAPLFFWLFLLACVALLLFLLAHIAWSVRQMLFASARRAAHEGVREERRRLSRTYLEEADRLATREDFTEAVRCLFLALIYRFDETGRVLFQRASTNREYLDLFQDNLVLRGHLQIFVDILDDHWYGQRPMEATRYKDCRELYEIIQ